MRNAVAHLSGQRDGLRLSYLESHLHFIAQIGNVGFVWEFVALITVQFEAIIHLASHSYNML
jgi:hypothetical protein